MQLETLISRIDLFTAQLKERMPEISDEVAMNAIAMIKNRIVDRREGLPGKAYSIKTMLATKSQFVVKSAFKQSTIETTQFYYKKNKAGIKKKTTFKGNEKKVVKKKLWLRLGKAKKAVPIMVLEQGYRQFREIQGRPGDHVNLSYTGKMWQGTTIVARFNNGYTWGTVIGGSNIEVQRKLNWNTKRFGVFLSVNAEETDVLRKVFNNRLKELFDTIILAA